MRGLRSGECISGSSCFGVLNLQVCLCNMHTFLTVRYHTSMMLLYHVQNSPVEFHSSSTKRAGARCFQNTDVPTNSCIRAVTIGTQYDTLPSDMPFVMLYTLHDGMLSILPTILAQYPCTLVCSSTCRHCSVRNNIQSAPSTSTRASCNTLTNTTST